MISFFLNRSILISSKLDVLIIDFLNNHFCNRLLNATIIAVIINQFNHCWHQSIIMNNFRNYYLIIQRLIRILLKFLLKCAYIENYTHYDSVKYIYKNQLSRFVATYKWQIDTLSVLWLMDIFIEWLFCFNILRILCVICVCYKGSRYFIFQWKF